MDPVLLAFPPAWEPDHPYLAPACLAGALRHHGIATELWDLNFEVIRTLLSRPHLVSTARRISEELAQVAEQEQLTPATALRYEAQVQAALLAQTMGDLAETSLAALREEELWRNPEIFSQLLRMAGRGLQLAAAAHSPTRLDWHGATGPWDTRSLDSLLQVVGDAGVNPYHAVVRQLLAQRLAEQRPALLGITLVDPQQWLGLLTLAQAFREQAPGVRIVVGGPLIRVLADQLPRLGRLFELVDGLVLGEGETPLTRITRATAAGQSWHAIPGVVYRDDLGQVRINSPEVEDFRHLPRPDFRGLPLGSYLSPAPVLPLQFSRSCYWRRCAFCSLGTELPPRTRVRRPAEIVEQMQQLQREHGVRHFFFTDDALPPAPLRQMAGQIAHDRLPFRWAGEIRLDRHLQPEDLAVLAAGGCRMLVFGLESGHPHTLTAMRKGIELDHVDRLLRAAVDARIAVHLWLITGFPGETRAEARASLDFLLQRPWLTSSDNFSAAFNRFVLPVHAPVALEGGAGLCVLQQPDPRFDLDQEVPFSPLPRADGETPMQPEEAERMAALLQTRLDEVITTPVRQNGRIDNFLRQCEGLGAPVPSEDNAQGLGRDNPGPGEPPVQHPPGNSSSSAPTPSPAPGDWPGRLQVVRDERAAVAWLSHPLPMLTNGPPGPARRYPRTLPQLLYHASSDTFAPLPPKLGAILELLERPALLEPIWRKANAVERRIILDLLGLGALHLLREQGDSIPVAEALGHSAARQYAIEQLAQYDEQNDAHCLPGCTRCCRATLPVSPADAALLRTGLRQLPAGTRDRVAARVRLQPADVSATRFQPADHLREPAPGDCPLLEQDRCLLYGFRPLHCVLFGQPTSDRPEYFCSLRLSRHAGRPHPLAQVPSGLFQLWLSYLQPAPDQPPLTLKAALAQLIDEQADCDG